MERPEPRQPSRSVPGYLIVASLLVAAKLLMIFGTVRFPAANQAAQFSWTFIAGLAAAGCVGALLSDRAGFPEIWLPRGTARRRFLLPLLLGMAVGLPLVILDVVAGTSALAARALSIPAIHMPPPESFLIYPAAAVMVETILRLVPVPLLVWLVSSVLLRGRGRDQMFWVVAAVLALVEPHQQGTLFRGNTALLAFYYPYGYLVEMLQMYWFRREGFLAAYALRVGDYLVWHVLWGGWLLGG